MEATRELYRIKSLGLVVEASKGAVLSLQLSASSLEVDRGVKGVGFVKADRGAKGIGFLKVDGGVKGIDFAKLDKGVKGIGFVDVDRIAYN